MGNIIKIDNAEILNALKKYDQTVFRWKFIKAANNYFY